MTTPPTTLVVIDTDVFSVVYVRDSGNRAHDLRRRLLGRLPVIATQTRAELMIWPRRQGWGGPRVKRLADLLSVVRRAVCGRPPRYICGWFRLNADVQPRMDACGLSSDVPSSA